MTQKWLKRVARIAVYGVLAILLADAALHLVSRTEWFKNRIYTLVQHTLGRDIQIQRMGVNLSGIVLDGLMIAEQGGFEKGVFLEAGRLRVQISLIHLLYGHTKITRVFLGNATLRATVFEDGSTSWADLVSAETTEETPVNTSSITPPFYITAKQVHIENLHLIYVDNTTAQTLDIDGLTLGVDHFSWEHPFSFYAQAHISPTLQGKSLRIPLAIQGTVDLQNLNLAQATVHLKALTAAYNKSTVTIGGKLENFENPQADLNFTFRNLSSEKLDFLPETIPFELEKATAHIRAAVNLNRSAFTLHHMSVKAPGLETQVQGGLLYGNPQQIKYDFSTQSTFVLGEMGRWLTALADPYRFVGTAQLSATATQQQVSAEVTLEGIGGKLPQAGSLSDIDGHIHIQEGMDLTTGKGTGKIAGKLNGRPFVLSARGEQTPQKIDVYVNANADEVMFRLPAGEKPAVPVASTANTSQKSWPLAPIHLRTDIQLGKVDVPYFYGNKVSFTADLEGITPDLKQAHGTLRLQTGAGIIQDIYKLTDANPLTKVLFLSLNITGKVFNTLNVFGVLGSIGSGISTAVAGDKNKNAAAKTQTILGPDGEPLEINVLETEKKVSGEMEYDKFDTEVNFVRGLATIKKGTFVSPTMSFRLDGTTDFNTQQIDMTVHAAPGRHEVDGMMPLSLKIGGTIDNPKGDMQLLGSMTSLVTQSVTNNVVSRQVGKGIKGFFGLFTKDKDDNKVQEQTQGSPNDKSPAEPDN